MTLAEFRGIKQREGEAAVAAPHGGRGAGITLRREAAHPGPAEYARVGLALAVVTAIEVALYYMGMARWLLVTALIILSAIKFSLVVLWFMHLKFDSPLFSWMFAGALALAAAIFVVVLATMGAGLV